MRHSLFLLAWILAAEFLVGSASADIEYHFVPGFDGQPSGYAQFAEIAPEIGPKDFAVTVSGALVGSEPSDSPNSAYAYLDKWGMGVLNPQVNDVSVMGQVLLDGNHGGEYLRLEFPEEVQLTYLTFAFVGSVDRFELLADGQQVDLLSLFPGTPTIKGISDVQGNWPGHVDFTQAVQPLDYAKVWDVVMSGPGFGDGIQLENVGVTTLPEPSTLVLVLTGLGFMGFYSTRRRILQTARRR